MGLDLFLDPVTVRENESGNGKICCNFTHNGGDNTSFSACFGYQESFIPYRRCARVARRARVCNFAARDLFFFRRCFFNYYYKPMIRVGKYYNQDDELVAGYGCSIRKPTITLAMKLHSGSTRGGI